MDIRKFNLRYLIGFLAVAISAALVAVAYHQGVERDEVTVALIVGLAVLSFEVFLVYVVVDQLLAAREKKQRQYAYVAIGKAVATCFVDVMRIVYATTKAIEDPERKRLPVLQRFASNHMEDLRSYIEGFASILDDRCNADSRSLEVALRWLFQSLDEKEVESIHCNNELATRYFKQVRILALEVFNFLQEMSLEEF